MRRLLGTLIALLLATATVGGQSSASFLFACGDSGGFNPADGTSYFMVNAPGFDCGTTQPVTFLVIAPFAGRVTSAAATVTVSGTLGTTETFTIRVRNRTQATTANITTAAQANTVFQGYTNAAMSLSVAQFDSIEIEMVTPTWSTNPTAMFLAGAVNISR